MLKIKYTDWGTAQYGLETRDEINKYRRRSQYRLKGGKAIAEIAIYLNEDGDAFPTLVDWKARGDKGEQAKLLEKLGKIFAESARFCEEAR